MKYEWTSGRERGVPAQIVGEWLADVEAEYGSVSAPNVVLLSQPPDALLHHLFTWNDAVAAARWRVREARQILSSIEIIDNGRRSPAFVSVSITSGDAADRGYVSSVRLATEDEWREFAVAEIRKAIAGWRRRFSHLTDLWDRLDTAIDG